jgi:hypothetical protein
VSIPRATTGMLGRIAGHQVFVRAALALAGMQPGERRHLAAPRWFAERQELPVPPDPKE